MGYRDDELQRLVGLTISKIQISEDHLVFDTNGGIVAYVVDGDCCSRSYFHDFLGVKNLLAGGPVTEFKEVPLSDDDPRAEVAESDYESIQCYGYQLTTNHPQFGPVTSVFSFRNSSNGYYGGDMRSIEMRNIGEAERKELKELTDDVTEVQ